jgi:hypothetical protein
MAANATSWSRSASAAATAAPSILDMGTIVSDSIRGPRLGALGIGLCCGLDRAALVGEARVPVPEVRGQVDSGLHEHGRDRLSTEVHVPTYRHVVIAAAANATGMHAVAAVTLDVLRDLDQATLS